jgi:hypothetical protein
MGDLSTPKNAVGNVGRPSGAGKLLPWALANGLY